MQNTLGRWDNKELAIKIWKNREICSQNVATRHKTEREDKKRSEKCEKKVRAQCESKRRWQRFNLYINKIRATKKVHMQCPIYICMRSFHVSPPSFQGNVWSMKILYYGNKLILCKVYLSVCWLCICIMRWFFRITIIYLPGIYSIWCTLSLSLSLALSHSHAWKAAKIFKYIEYVRRNGPSSTSDTLLSYAKQQMKTQISYAQGSQMPTKYTLIACLVH